MLVQGCCLCHQARCLKVDRRAHIHVQIRRGFHRYIASSGSATPSVLVSLRRRHARFPLRRRCVVEAQTPSKPTESPPCGHGRTECRRCRGVIFMPEVQVSVAETPSCSLADSPSTLFFGHRRSGVLLCLPGGRMALQMVAQELGIGWCDSVAERALVNVRRDVIEPRRR